MAADNRSQGEATMMEGGIASAREAAPGPAGRCGAVSAARHFAHFYDQGSFPAAATAEFLWSGIRSGESGLAILTPEHADALRRSLAACGAPLEVLERSGRFIGLDARSTLQRMLLGGLPDRAVFQSMIAEVLGLATAAAPSGRVRVLGEMVSLLVSEGRFGAAAALEQLWEDLLPEHGVQLCCTYPIEAFLNPSLTKAFTHVCDAHEDVLPLRTTLEPPERHRRCIAILQQQAHVLQMEVAERRRTEAYLSTLLRFSHVLASSVDYEATAANVLSLAVPMLGSFGFLELLEPAGRLQRRVRAPGDPAAEALLARGDCLGWSSGPRGLRTPSFSGSALHPLIDDAWLRRVATGPEELALLLQLDLRSLIEVSLECQGHCLGRLVLGYSGSGRRHDGGQLELAQELAYRAAVALENANLHRERSAALHRLAEADRRKDEFLAMLGHELRNPIAPINTAVEVIEMHGELHCQRELAVIRRQAQHLTRLVEDLLDVSRIVRGRIVLQKKRLEIGSAVAEAVEMATPLLERMAHQVSLAVPRTGLVVNGDPFRLSQIVGNLLTNAAKYTSHGGQIRVDARAEGGDVVLQVSDTGCGIRPEMLGEIFEPFVQSQRTLVRAQGGLGLGLALVKVLTELHGGRVSAKSDGPGTGSTFTVHLPRVTAAADPILAAPPVTPLAAGGNGRRHVLLVDDNQDAADMLAMALQAEGYQVDVAHDGPEALVRAARSPPDVAVLDIGLPVMDGYEVAARLRTARPEGALRLIALTGYGQESDRERSAGAGFDLHLVKPVELKTILAAVGHGVERQRGQASAG